MSYGITLYLNDSGIATSSYYNYGSGDSRSGNYGDKAISYTGYSGKTSFRATPASGRKFTQWVYRLGSVSGTVRYSTDNPFVYDGEQNIFIRAESDGGGDTPTPPTPTATFSASCNATGQTTLAFSASYTGTNRYSVRLTINGSTYTLSASGSSGNYSYSQTISGLSPSTSYSWTAQLMNGNTVVETKSGTARTNGYGTGFLIDIGGAWRNAQIYIHNGSYWERYYSRLDNGSRFYTT